MRGDGLFSGDADNVIRWVAVAGVILALGSAALVGMVLLRRPAGASAAAVKWTLLIALLVFPSMTMLTANTVGFHRVRQSCAECHTMEPWVRDMKDPESRTLAALHYKNRWINEDQCYTCHTGYGLGGNVRAKMDGVKHVMHQYVTGVPDEIRIKRPFPTKTCLHCHGAAAGFNAIEQHADPEFKPKILSGEMSCFECHEAPHPRKRK